MYPDGVPATDSSDLSTAWQWRAAAVGIADASGQQGNLLTDEQPASFRRAMSTASQAVQVTVSSAGSGCGAVRAPWETLAARTSNLSFCLMESSPVGKTSPSASSSPYTGLRVGSTDASSAGRVSRLQEILHRWNPRLDVGPSGSYTTRTARAMTLYKAIYGSGSDGREVDARTAGYLSQMENGSFWSHPPKKSAAGKVLYEASRMLGTPYAMGGNGVSSTDCGMLTRCAMVRAHVTDASFSRMADHQYYDAKQGLKGLALRHGAPQSGDLVFFDATTAQSSEAYGGVTHVGLYVGDGLMLAASSGQGSVVLQSLDGMRPYVKAYGCVASSTAASAP